MCGQGLPWWESRCYFSRLVWESLHLMIMTVLYVQAATSGNGPPGECQVLLGIGPRFKSRGRMVIKPDCCMDRSQRHQSGINSVDGCALHPSKPRTQATTHWLDIRLLHAK